MATNIGPKIGIEGEAQFKREIASINSNLKTMGSEMKSVTSAFIGNEKSVEALTAQNEVLGSRMDALAGKTDLLKTRLKEMDDAGVDPSSEAYQRLLRQLYDTEAEMNKTEAEIKQNQSAMDGLGDETEETAKALDDGAKSGSRFADVLKAELLSKAITAGIKALGEGIKKLGGAVIDAAYAADDLNTLAKTTGLSTTELQRFQFAADNIDVSLDTLTGSMSKLTKNMVSASKGTGDTFKAFQKLGVEVKNQDGSLRDRNEVFNETIAALGKIENETERDAVAMQIFGKSAQDLNPLILGGADALQELGDQAEAAGLILSQDSLDQLNLVSDAMDTFKATTGAAGKVFVADFAEPLATGVNTLTGYIQQMTSAFSEGGFDALGEVIGNVLLDITDKLNEYLPQVVEFASGIINNLVLGITQMLPSIIQSAATIMTTLLTGLVDLIPQLIPVAVETVLTIVDALINNVSSLVDAAVAIILALSTGLIDALPTLIDKAPQIIQSLVDAIIANAPKLIVAAAQVIGQLVVGIIGSLGRIGEAAGSIVGTILTGLVNALASFVEAGGQIVSGIWQGIKGKAEWFKQQVKNFFSGIVNGVKKTLGIHSPSRVFAGIGTNMALGLGEGFEGTMSRVERDMRQAVPTVMGGMQPLSLPAALPATGADIAGALSGLTVVMDGRKVGQLVTSRQATATRRLGEVAV